MGVVVRSSQGIPLTIGSQSSPLTIGKGITLQVNAKGGGSEAVEKYFLVTEAIEVENISQEDIIAETQTLWQAYLIDQTPITPISHSEEVIADINTNKTDSALEGIWDIPDTIRLTAASSTDIQQAIADTWQAFGFV